MCVCVWVCVCVCGVYYYYSCVWGVSIPQMIQYITPRALALTLARSLAHRWRDEIFSHLILMWCEALFKDITHACLN